MITPGFEVLVQLVIAAITTARSGSVQSAPPRLSDWPRACPPSRASLRAVVIVRLASISGILSWGRLGPAMLATTSASLSTLSSSCDPARVEMSLVATSDPSALSTMTSVAANTTSCQRPVFSICMTVRFSSVSDPLNLGNGRGVRARVSESRCVAIVRGGSSVSSPQLCGHSQKSVWRK